VFLCSVRQRHGNVVLAVENQLGELFIPAATFQNTRIELLLVSEFPGQSVADKI